MKRDIESLVKDSLDQLVRMVDADQDELERRVAHRVAVGRRRRHAIVVTGLAVTVAALISAPLIVLDRSGDHDGLTTDPTVQVRATSAQAYGQHLISLVDLPTGAHRVHTAPVPGLENPQEQVLLNPKPIHVRAWWTLDAPAVSVWRWVTQHRNSGLTWQGTAGAFPSPDGIRPPVASVELAPSAGLRAGFSYGLVDVIVASLGSGRSAIAVIATVEPLPTLPLAEHVPTQGVSAVVGWHPHADARLQRVSLSPAASSRLAVAFNELPATTLGAHSCPVQLGMNDVTVTFRARGHTWVVDYSGCFELTVARNGVDLRTLTVSWIGEGSRPPGQGDFLEELNADGITRGPRS